MSQYSDPADPSNPTTETIGYYYFWATALSDLSALPVPQEVSPADFHPSTVCVCSGGAPHHAGWQAGCWQGKSLGTPACAECGTGGRDPACVSERGTNIWIQRNDYIHCVRQWALMNKKTFLWKLGLSKEARKNAITHPQSHQLVEFTDGLGLRMDNYFER